MAFGARLNRMEMDNLANSTPRRAVVVMGKLPRPGRVKTRLTRALSPTQAAALYQAFLADTFRLVARAAPDKCAFVFACALGEGDDLAEARTLAPSDWRVVAQAGEGLGERIEHARQQGVASAGEGAVVLVMGSDSPTLPAARLTDTFAALEEGARVAIVPTEDGGYAVIGFAEAADAVLTGIPWSTEAVMDATRKAASEAGIGLVELATAYDIDYPEDLARAQRDATPAHHPATTAALASLGGFGL